MANNPCSGSLPGRPHSLHACARRASCHRAGHRAGFPRWDLLRARWLPAADIVLRPVGLPDHRVCCWPNDRASSERACADSGSAAVRRLAPGAVLGLAAVAAYVEFGADNPASSIRGDAVASVFWMTNWRFILDKQVYADAFHDPSPLQHYWSLAVEEQFYLVLPILFVATLAVVRGRRWLFASAVAALAVTSTVWMAHIHTPGAPPLRAYFGTDTRAAELLVGVLLALALVDRSGRLRRFDRGRRAVDVIGAIVLGVSVVSWFAVREYDDRLYEGGLALVAILAAAVATAATQTGTVVDRVLRTRPLVWIGRHCTGSTCSTGHCSCGSTVTAPACRPGRCSSSASSSPAASPGRR